MKQFIFLTNQYLPKPGATGMCVHSVAAKLAKRGVSVYTICYSHDSNYYEEEYDGVKVLKIPVPFFLRDFPSDKLILKKSARLMSILAKIVHIKDYPIRSNTLVKRYVNKVNSILKNGEKTTIIASYTPLEAAVALLRLKVNNDVKAIFYSTDTLSNEKGNGGLLPAKKRISQGIKWEKQILSFVDKAIIMECHADHYFSNIFAEFHQKILPANFPLLQKPINMSIESKNNKFKLLVYAGTLYKDLRNPSYLCELLTRIVCSDLIKVVFMGGGDCDEIMNFYKKRTNGLIEFLGMQSYNIASKYVNDADVLLSIGNAESPMAPSKIYEYMSTGKPIIHTYTWEYDPCILPLKKYDNALLLNENKTVDINIVLDFINRSHILPYEEVESRFITSTPDYTANIVEKL